MPAQFKRLGWAGLLLALALAQPAWAHRVKLFAAWEGQAAAGQAYFPDGGKIKGATVKVLGAEGKDLAALTTDDQGRFTYRPEKPQDLRFVLDLDDGHVAEFRLGAGSGAPAPPAPAAQPQAAPPALDQAALARLVEAAVSRQIAPLLAQLDRSEAKIRWHDVLGGLGYIMGLMGLVLYWRAKRPKA
jgi:nickel transport protein